MADTTDRRPDKPRAAALLLLLVATLTFVNAAALPQVSYFIDIPSFLMPVAEYTVGSVLGVALGGLLGGSMIDALATFVMAL